VDRAVKFGQSAMSARMSGLPEADVTGEFQAEARPSPEQARDLVPAPLRLLTVVAKQGRPPLDVTGQFGR
jgi:hypothetical protein